MDKKLLVLLAVALFGAGFVVCGDNGASDVKKAEPAAKEGVGIFAEPKAPKTAEVKAVKKSDCQTGRPILKTTLLYLPNRLLDILDIVTVDIGAGAGFGVEARATHWMQFGGMYGDKYFLDKGYARQLGGGYASGWNYEFLCLTSERRYVDGTFGMTIDPFMIETREFILKRKPLSLAMPEDDFTYSHHIRDFWEIGANAGWLITVGVAVHPVEIADFFAGLILIDFKGDDYGASSVAAEEMK